MNKVMILAILVAYKGYNDKSLTIVTKDDGVYNRIDIVDIEENFIKIQRYYIT